MNRYWGRNENGSLPKFSRDDDQLLALNYENLCDGDYLNRLFSSDSAMSGCDDTSGDNLGAAGPTDTIALFNVDLPEDIILHGDNFNLGKSLARARFHKQVLSSVKYQDAATNLINRQSIVYEHIGRLMIDRCSIPPVLQIKREIKSVNKSNISTSGLINNMAATALDCCLKLLDIGKCHNLGCATLEPLIALVFHVSQESALKASNPSIVSSSNVSISVEHISILRSVFCQAAMKCHSSTFTERHRSAIEESFRSSMAAFYGLLALGLHTRNPSEIVAAITHLMLILLRAEEWYAWYKAESKLQLSAALATIVAPISTANLPSTPVLPGDKTNSLIGATTKMAMKGKVAAESHKSKVGNKVNNPVATSSSNSSGPTTQQPMQGTLIGLKDTPLQQSGVSSSAVLSVPPGNTNLTVPSLTAATERGGGNAMGGFVGNNMHILEQQHEDSRAESGPVQEHLPASLIPTSSSHNNSSIPNMKTWDGKQPNSKLPSDKERDHTPSRSKPMKNIKAEARVIQEILDPNMFTAQELSAYYASNPNTVNYVMKANPNQGPEMSITATVNKQQSAAGIPSKKPPGSSTSSACVSNNNISLIDGNIMAIDGGSFTRPDGHAMPYRSASSGSNSNTNTSAAAVSRHKKNMAEFKESLQSLLRIPKPMLKVLHDCCVVAADDDCEKRQLSSVGLATNTIQNSSVNLPVNGTATPMSTYVWSCGQNSYGELGLGDSAMRKSFSRVSCMDDKRVVSIGAGNEHSLFVTQEGKLLTAGYNDNGQCGMGTTQQVRQPTVVTALEGEDIAQVHVYNGCEHTLAVTRDGKIFSFGYNYRGQLGLGNTTSECTPRPIRGLLSRRVVLAACSYHHSVMLCSDGSVYTCGRNDSGQLGHGDVIDKKTPQSVLNCPRGIVSISCGQFHTVAATSSGSAFVCGKNDFGQLGMENTNMVKVFAELPPHPEIESVVQVCCGYYHTLLLSNTGIVAGFGRNDYGQLGLGHAIQKVFTCTPIIGLRDKGVRMVAAGCYHTVVITTNGMLYVFGRNNHGQLATGDSEERHSPHPVDNFVGQHIISVSAGFYHTIVLTAAPSTSDGTSKHAISTGGFLAPKLGLSDVLEQLNSPIGLGDSPLHPIMGDARANAQSILLMKDAAHLTGIKALAGSRSAFIVPFSLDRLSRVSSRELLTFLTAHIESLVTAAPQSTVVDGSDSESKCEGERVCAQWVTNTLCCLVATMELCCGILEDAEGTSTLPLSFEEALYFISRFVKIASGLLHEYQTCILECISSVQSQNQQHTSNPPANLQFLSEILSFDTKKQGNYAMKAGTINSSKIMSVFKQCGLWEDQQMEVSNSSTIESKEKSACEAMNLLRRKLLTVYFTLTPREQHQNPKFQTVVTEIALLFAQSHRILLPSAALVAEFYTVMRVYTMPPLTTSVSAFHQSLCVRMMTIFSASYRSSEEVVRMFQESKLDSLVVFRHMLSLYGHFSMHNLVKRMHLTKSSISGVHQSTSMDVRRLISVLEQCISNFIKCAVPIIFAAGAFHGQWNSSAVESTPSTQSALLFQSGVEIVREVLADAMRLVDYVQSQQQSQSEDMLGQLRYGTIMPSILPSLLIYGIAFAKHRCLMLEVVPDVSQLIEKLQLLGRCDTTTGKATVASSGTSKTELGSPTEKRASALETGISNLGGSFRAAVGQLGSSLSTALDRGGVHTLQGLLKEEEASVAAVDTVDIFSEDYLLSKRDPQQMAWWFRLVKLSTTFVAKMSAALISPPLQTTTAVGLGGTMMSSEFHLSERQQLIAYHNVWRFASVATFITHHMPSLLIHINTILAEELEQRRASEEVISACAARREKEKAVDPVYRMLSLSVQSAFSSNILNLIEESLLEAVVKVAGQSTLLVGNIAPVFKLLSRFTKRIHSRRSELVSHAQSNTSWVELLITLNNVIKVFCIAVSEGNCCIDQSAPLVLPRGKAKGSLRAKAAWRRALMVVLCMKRWQTCWRLRMKNIAANVIDFVTVGTSIVTDNLQSLPEGNELSARIAVVLKTLALAGQEADNYNLGLRTAQTLLGGLPSNSLRSDVMTVLNAALREKADAMKLRFDADRFASVPDGELSLQHCRTVALHVRPRAVEPMRNYLLNITSALRANSGVFTQQELHFLSSSVKFMQLLILENSLDMCAFGRETIVPLCIIKELLLQLRDRQQLATTANTAIEEKATAAKKPTANMRERNAAYRRTAQDLVSFLQAMATTESFHSLASRPYWCAQLVDAHNYLISTFQTQRIEAMKLDALNEEATRLSVDGKEAGQVTSTHTGLLISSSSLINKPQSKDGNRRRCQDLITKPMEFCRTVEGFVVQGEKLLNNYKGVDFTVAFWVMLAKKSTAKYSFIAGKVSHSDSWPIVLLRNDGKLEILYGHTSEVEKMISVASIAPCSWAHVAVIVEQKKIKLFMNGVLDSHVSTAKGNSKAVLFPLLVGSCPTNVRTKVPQVKEGFDGMLAHFKYYSRALSPIHVKIVHDNGPPDTSDVTAKLIYQMMSSLKCLYKPVHPIYLQSELCESAGIMHMVFVTDSSRRNRFAALHILTEILLLDVMGELDMWSHWNVPSATGADPQPVSLMKCSFLSKFATFHEKMVVYFLRLAGACWAPHLLASLENIVSGGDKSVENAGNISATGRLAETNAIHEFLRHAPSLTVSSDPGSALHPYSLNASASAASSVVDKFAGKKEVRGEICHHVLGVLKKLAAVKTWNIAISTVVRRTLESSTIFTQAMVDASLPLKFDTLGVSLLLGGGTSGPYVGVNARSFFGDAAGKILSINRTTNFATMLCYNSIYAHQQVVKVRVSDLIIAPKQDAMSLTTLQESTDVFPAVLSALDTLAGYMPLLLSDYMSSLRPPESMLQRTILKGLRPVEVFLFNQLLQGIANGGSSTSLSAEISSHPALLNVLQQASIAAVEVLPAGAQHHLGDNRAAYTPPSLGAMWFGCAHYLLGMPEKVVSRPLLGTEDVKALCDFVSRNFSMPTDSILVAPHAQLLKQGRISELAQLLSLNDGNVAAFGKTELGQLVEAYHSSSQLTEQAGFSGMFLMSDWPPTFANDWPMVVSDSLRNELYCGYMLTLLFCMRKEVITNSRRILATSTVAVVSTDQPTWIRDVAVWQAVLPQVSADGRVALNNMQDLLLQPRTAMEWIHTCARFYQHKKVEVTQMIAASLKYFSLALMQVNPLQSSENLFESLDLFKRIMRTAMHWVDYADTQREGEEVMIGLLRIILPILSFIDNSLVALQLTQLCMHLVRKLTARAFEGYLPSRELSELVKNNNFTLLRARAQEQISKYKTHNMGSISALAYNLTQLVCSLELIQRQGASEFNYILAEGAQHGNPAGLTTPPGSAVKASVASASKNAHNLHTARIQHTETAMPKISAVRATSVDCDMTACAETVLKTVSAFHDKTKIMESEERTARTENIVIEVAIGTASSASTSRGEASADCYFETVYCGTSLRLVQSNLVPECTYYIKCRAYLDTTALSWSPVVEFRTQKGVLFTFDTMKCGPDIHISEDGLSASYANDDTWSTVLGSRPFSSGVTHWSIRINSSSTAYIFVGVACSGADLSSFLGGCAQSWGFIGEQALYHNREKVKVYGESFSSGDVVGVTLDLNRGTMSFSRNNKPLGVAFDKIFGELYPAVAFYNLGQELTILSESCSTTCAFESIPVSPSRMNMDDISVLSELALSLYRKQPLSLRLQALVAEHCNQWCNAGLTRCRAVSGRDVFLATQSALLSRFALTVGERVRTPFGVAEVAGSAFNKVWFYMNEAGEVWYFSAQQLLDGRNKKMFIRCSYDSKSEESTDSSSNSIETADVSSSQHMTFDTPSVHELLEPSKWSDELDHLLLSFLSKQMETAGLDSPWKVTSQQVTENFRTLHQQFSRIIMDNHELTHRWGIAGPKRKAVLARIGLLRLFNQMLDMYLPFLVADSSSKAFVLNQPTLVDDFAPLIVSVRPEDIESSTNEKPLLQNATVAVSEGRAWTPPNVEHTSWPLISLSWDEKTCTQSVLSREMLTGPIHAIRRLVFYPMKMSHFWEVLRRSTTRPAKTEDDYDYPDDLPHVKINRLKSFRAREASELLLIPGEDLMLSSMFCQLWRELRQHNDEKLRISYTHPMDDGQSRTFKIKFEGEGVDDYGGPYREIFQQICEELQSTDPSAGKSNRPSSWLVGEDKQTGVEGFATASSAIAASSAEGKSNNTADTTPIPTRCFLPLLMPTPNWTADTDCAERYRYMFHPAAESPLKMDLYHFLGQLVGIAVRSKITLDLAFPSYVWKYVVCERLTEHDIGSFDASAYNTLQRLGSVHKALTVMEAEKLRGETVDASALAMLQYNALELIGDLTWCYTRSDGVVLELIEGRGQQAVELADVGKYLVLYAEARLNEGRNAIGMFRKGLVSILPESSLSLLNWEELQAVVCGPRTIDVQRLKDNTEYDDDISPDDEHIVLFWEVLSGFSEAEKSAFLRFVWARPTLPPKDVEFSQKMRVLSAVGEDAHMKPDLYLPKAHTCFFSINLPKYSTKQLMTEKLLYAIFNCTEMDADFRTTETDVVGWSAAATGPTDWQSTGTAFE